MGSRAQLRGGRRGDSQGDRRGRRCPARSFRPARRNSRAPGAGPLPGRTSWPSCSQDVRQATMVVALGITMTGDKRFRLETDTEREGVDPVPPVIGRAGPRCLPGASGDRGWRQGSGRPCGKPSATAPWCNGVSGTRARTVVTWPSVSSRCGGAFSAPTTVRSTTRPSPPSSQHELEDRIRGRQSGGRPRRP